MSIDNRAQGTEHVAEHCLLVIDQGTHASRTALVSADGRVLQGFQRPVGLHRDGPRVEQDAAELIASVRDTMQRALGHAREAGLVVQAAALATQRSTVVAWDRIGGTPLAPALSWQDTRAAADLETLGGAAKDIQARTGLRLSPHYGVSKIAWLLREVPAVRSAREAGRLAVGPLAAFLLHGLLVGQPLRVDHANAARTLLWNLRTRDWDPALLQRFRIDRTLLPDCRPIRGEFGRLGADPRVSVTAVSGDQTAALFADGAPRAGSAYVNLGTGAFVLAAIGEAPRLHPRLLTGIADSSDGAASYALEGTVNGAGAALAWAREHWHLQIDDEALDACLAEAPEPPVFLNGVGGLGSPWWHPDLPSRLLEVPGSPTPAARMAAVLESIAFLVTANVRELQTATPLHELRLSGGLSRSDALCQRLADLNALPVWRARESEATLRGAAWLAAAGPAHWRQTPVEGFTPRPAPELAARYDRFIQAIEDALAHA